MQYSFTNRLSRTVCRNMLYCNTILCCLANFRNVSAQGGFKGPKLTLEQLEIFRQVNPLSESTSKPEDRHQTLLVVRAFVSCLQPQYVSDPTSSFGAKGSKILSEICPVAVFAYKSLTYKPKRTKCKLH